MNGYVWRVMTVPPHSPFLIDRSNTPRLATTDPTALTVYLSTDLYGDMLSTVLLHELGHCAIFSYDLLDDIHSAVLPQHWEEAEEWVCNFIADYGRDIFRNAYSVLGNEAFVVVPYTIDKKVS